MPGIFISYRRDDAAGWAGRLSADLRAGLRGAPVFMDIDAIPPGVPYDDYIAQAVGSCDVLIALIGPHWLTVTDKAGRRRLDDPADLTRLEILAALQRNIRVIPALVGGAEMPAADELPDALKPLGRRQAYELADHRWNEDCARLVGVLKPIFRAKPSGALRVVTGLGLVAAILAAGYAGTLWFDRQSHERAGGLATTPSPPVLPTPTPAPSPTAGPTPTPEASPNAAPTPASAPTPAPTPTPTPAPTPAPTRTKTPRPTPTPTPFPPDPKSSSTPNPQGAGAAGIRLSSAELDFGARALAGDRSAKTSGLRFVITNLTSAPLDLKYAVRGSSASEFPVIGSDCDKELTGGMTVTKTCYVGFGFSPAELGARRAVVTLYLRGSAEQHQVVLTGTGVSPQAAKALVVLDKSSCTRLSEESYRVELWGHATGPEDAVLSVFLGVRLSRPPLAEKHELSCRGWKSSSMGSRKLCLRGGAASESTAFDYLRVFATRDLPSEATVSLNQSSLDGALLAQDKGKLRCAAAVKGAP